MSGVLPQFAFVAAALACLHPSIGSATALIAGLALALSIGNPWAARTRAWTPRLLSYSVVGLGAGMDLVAVGRAGMQGLATTAVSITLVFGLGLLLGRVLSTERRASLLLSAGTAICGGSAIAAAAGAIRARPAEISVALGTVFLLNATALVLFPWIGHALSMSQDQFGLWAALAIHDTSSVVGACLAYGARALELGTTVKLARALWIVPLTVAIAQIEARREPRVLSAVPAKRPWFILGFLIAAALATYVPGLRAPGDLVAVIARRLLVVVLFLIGSGLNRQTIGAVGWRPFAQGLALWILAALGSLSWVLYSTS